MRLSLAPRPSVAWVLRPGRVRRAAYLAPVAADDGVVTHVHVVHDLNVAHLLPYARSSSAQGVWAAAHVHHEQSKRISALEA